MFDTRTEIILVSAGLMVLAILFLMSMLARLYRKAGPHEALIVYGFRGTRVVQGHGTVIFPMVENCKDLSLELMSFDVAPQQDLYTKQGVAVNGDTAGTSKITGDITKMAAQVPALFETLSGMPLGELLGKVRQIGDKAPKPQEK